MGAITLRFRSMIYLVICLLSACGNPNDNDASEDSNIAVLSGTIFFEDIPLNNPSFSAELNYDAAQLKPAVNVTVHLLDSQDNTISTSQTDQHGHYSFNVERQRQVRVAAIAESVSSEWHISIKDNTNNNRTWGIQGKLATVDQPDTERHLTALSGWTGASYGNDRAAAPFAILAVAQEMAAITQQTLPEVTFYWSPNNRASSGNISDGDIVTSYYDLNDGVHSIYLLGSENLDTDEYDKDVIAHEFTHFLETALSKRHSIGGPHSERDYLDFRVAFSEGLANAIAGEYTQDGIYSDSAGPSQAFTAVWMDVENNATEYKGWFTTGAIQRIIYDVMDNNNDGETLTLGMKGIIDLISSSTYRDSPALASIYLFEDTLRTLHPSSTTTINQLLSNMDIFGSGPWGAGETNDALSLFSMTLPVYTEITLNETVNLCVSNHYGNINRLDNFRFLRFTTQESRHITINVIKSSSRIERDTDPNILLSENGTYVAGATSTAKNEELLNYTVTQGTHVIVINDHINTDNTLAIGDGLACFDITLR